MKRPLLIFIFAIIALGCKEKSEEKPAPPLRSYPVVEINKTTVNGNYSFPTAISGKSEDEIRPKINGFIKEIYVDEGQMVSVGDPLFKLETNTQQMDARAAKAAVLGAEANIMAAEGAVAAAQVEVDKMIPLVEQDIVGQVQLETARANLLKAKGQLSMAKAERDKAEASYYAILENIQFSEITSPLNGIVGGIPYSVGTLTGPEDPTPLTTVSDNSEIYAYISLTEEEYIDFFQKFEGVDLADKIDRLPPIDLELANGSLYDEKGKVETTTGIIDPSTGTIQFRILFPNSGGLLKSGNSGVIRVPRIYKDVIAIPNVATFEQQGMVYVYAVENDTVKTRLINVVDKLELQAIVDNGLEPGEHIIVSGLATLRNGTAISPNLVSVDSVLNTSTNTP